MAETAGETVAPRGAPEKFVPVTDRPWAALLALCIGFFMILVDMSIVAVAQPQIQAALGASVNGIVWVTSAYLLMYAVPLLIAGRLGDKFGPKRVYQAGLVVFTLASLWCGLAGSIGELIAARGVQGVGAALITPQTMALITRIFPPEKRGGAMGVWGIVAGVATMIGPLLGGVLTDSLGWEWIFFINLPIGVIGLVLAQAMVPTVETHDHRFDWVGVVLSAAGLFAIVFGIQEGETFGWAPWIWALIAGGVLTMGLFLTWEAKTRTEALVPLALFRDRNFSLASIGIATVGFAVSGMMIPLMFFLQLVGGMSPTRSALMMVPMAVLSGIAAPVIGRILDRVHPRAVISTSMFTYAVSVAWMGWLASPETPVWLLILPSIVMGVASGGLWAPLAATATRNLPWHSAGAGAGVYNTTRVVGSVVGTASIGAVMMTRLGQELPGVTFASAEGHHTARLPEILREGFATAMGQSIYLGAAALLVGGVVSLFLVRPAHQATPVAGMPDAAGPANRVRAAQAPR